MKKSKFCTTYQPQGTSIRDKDCVLSCYLSSGALPDLVDTVAICAPTNMKVISHSSIGELGLVLVIQLGKKMKIRVLRSRLLQGRFRVCLLRPLVEPMVWTIFFTFSEFKRYC